MRLHRWMVVLVLVTAGNAQAALPFLAPAVPVGTVNVQLCPTEGIAAGSSRLVTFGVPMPRGSLTLAGLSTLRVTKGSTELAAFVDQLVPWRHRSNAALDGASVRVARVQLNYSFAGTACETVAVSWGGPPRTQNIAALTPPRNGWHAATSGTFGSSDSVEEPDVYAVLPKEWLSHGVLKGVRSLPFAATVASGRDSPAMMDASEHRPGLVEADHAHKNNFYSVINEDDAGVSAANRCQYKTDYEPWLYDRAATMYTLYFRSGSGKALREAIRASDFYADHLTAAGYFSLKDGDAKYVYAENLAYTAWLTGDTSQLGKLTAIVAALDSYNHVWSTNPDLFWTERHSAFKLLANQIAYEVNGGTQRRDKVNALIAELVRHQNGANGAIAQPAGYVDGGFYHFGSQHDGDWADASLGASSWMSVLIVDAVLRSYATAEDAASANILRRLGNFMRASTISTTEHSYDTYDAALALPRYAILSNGSDGQVNYEDVEHALDVATGVAWGAYFADLAGQPAQAQALRDSATALYLTYDIGVNFWVRPAGPASGQTAFRVSPWRKWGWEHRVSSGFAWAMNALGGDVIFDNGFD